MTDATRPAVLLVVADTSLGGTSRSALQAVRAWRSSGHEVVVLAELAGGAGRQVTEDALVTSVTSLDDVPWERIGLVHLHHWNWAADERARVSELIDRVSALPDPPRLLTNNIFSSPDPLLARWPGPRAVGVLGAWAVHQYRTAMAGRRHPAPFVIGNPQDLGFFRPPSDAERAEARRTLDLGDQPVVLRLGSPLDNKWSPDYVDLATACDAAGARLVLISPPQSLVDALRDAPAVTILERISDDDLIRLWYWGADVFAHDALRGESFGNVIMEALGTGLPVVYRGRPLRDNTPWEFRDLPGFSYVEDQGRWIATCLEVARQGRQVPVGRTRAAIEDRYGVAAIGRQLSRAASVVTAAPRDRATVDGPAEASQGLSAAQRLTVAVRHNPAAALVKSTVNRLRESGAGSGVDLVGAVRRRLR